MIKKILINKQGKDTGRLFCFIAVVLLTACGSETSVVENKPINSSLITDSGCKSEASARSEEGDAFGQESISYKAQQKDNKWYLHVEHSNVMFNCASDTIKVKSQIDDDNTISINEIENSYGANCMCAHDITYDVGPLTEGTDYKISLYKSAINESDNYLQVQFTVKFSNDLTGEITIE